MYPVHRRSSVLIISCVLIFLRTTLFPDCGSRAQEARRAQFGSILAAQRSRNILDIHGNRLHLPTPSEIRKARDVRMRVRVF